MADPLVSGGGPGGGLPLESSSVVNASVPPRPISQAGRTHFDVTAEQLDELESAARCELTGLLDEWRPLIAADERLSHLAEAIAESQTKLAYIAKAREEIEAEASP